MPKLIRRAVRSVSELATRLGQLTDQLIGPRAPDLVPVPVRVKSPAKSRATR
jgi:hypothetical protein